MSEQRTNQGSTGSVDTGGVTPPPRFLLWLVIGLFLLAVLGSVGAVIVFRDVLLPGQQQRVIDQLPFMRVFMPPTPEGGTLPTAIPADSDISPEDLLAGPPALPALTTTAVPTLQPTEAAVLITIEPSATPTHTPPPTATPTEPPSPTPLPPTAVIEPVSGNLVNISQSTISIPEIPASARMFGFVYAKQTWNNCGPANLTMALSYYGWQRDQSYAAEFLKPDREDKNVNPQEMVRFVNEQSDLRAVTRIGGNLNLLKRLIAAQIPVIIETGYMPEGYDWLGHYQTLVAYDELQKVFYVYDSFLGSGDGGSGLPETYTDLDNNWKHFNRTFIVIYEPSRENEVRDILGDLADPIQAAEIALETARQEARANARDAFAWFNIGTALTRLGRYEEAAVAYDQARREGSLPWRMTWYQFGPFEAYYQTGRYDDVIALVNVNLTNGAQYVEETYYWQGKVLQARGDLAGARQAFSQALRRNYRYEEARLALDALNA